MPVDHDFEAGRFRFQIELSKIVQHVDGNAGEFDNFRLRQFMRPGFLVDVSADGRHGSEACEFLKNFRRAYIPGVNDVIGAPQGRQSFGPKQAVSIGNNADKNGSSQSLVFSS